MATFASIFLALAGLVLFLGAKNLSSAKSVGEYVLVLGVLLALLGAQPALADGRLRLAWEAQHGREAGKQRLLNTAPGDLEVKGRGKGATVVPSPSLEGLAQLASHEEAL